MIGVIISGMKRKCILLTAVSIMLLSLLLLYLIVNNDRNITERVFFTVCAKEKPESISTWSDGQIREYVFLPSYADLESVYFQIEPDEHFAINGTEAYDGMSCAEFETGKTYTLTYDIGKREYSGEIVFYKSSNVATMFIDTASGTMNYVHSDKEKNENCTVTIYNADGDLNYIKDNASISGRGNSTWSDFDKKPYSLTLQNEADLLGLGCAERWILLANEFDRTNMRNKIVFDFAKELGLKYTPDSQWVDLYLNGEYAGLYLLCERNEVHGERVDISEEGSFLVSAERLERMIEGNRLYVLTDAGQALRVHYLSEGVDVSGIMQSAENSIISEDGIDKETQRRWDELIDVDSWARKYLLEEIFANSDASAVSQFYYVDGADESGKIFAGPAWDYDASSGAQAWWQINETEVFYANRPMIRENESIPLIHSLYQKEEFYKLVVEIYESQCLEILDELLDVRVRSYAALLEESAKMNQIRWNHEHSSEEEVGNLVSFLVKRCEFLSELWLTDKTYHVVTANPGNDVHYLYYPVESGGIISELPDLADTETRRFIGWYDAETNERFDQQRPIVTDIEIYAQWEDKMSRNIEKIKMVVPLATIAAMGFGILLLDLRRMRKGW